MLRRERNNPGALNNGERIAKNNHCIGTLRGSGGKGGIELLGLGRLNYGQSHAQFPGCAGYLLGLCQPVHGVARINQDRNFRGARNEFREDFYLL
jgi:hypothetical protein